MAALSEEEIGKAEAWLVERNIDDIECMVTDFGGISRGKSMPRSKFIDGIREGGLRMPEAIFGITVNGGYVFTDKMTITERDMMLAPDLSTLRQVPWQAEPIASIICDAVTQQDESVPYSPRQALRRVVSLYEAKGWKPIVAPEFEFYLIARNDDPDALPKPPLGKSGRPGDQSNAYSIDAVDEFGPLFDDIYDYCEEQGIQIDTLIHEAGPAQFEINVMHGEAVAAADQSIMFKRAARQAAIRHNMFASFMAMPYPNSYGSAMHIHQSIVDVETGANIFADADGNDTALFLSHIAGMQTYLPSVMPMLAPFVNSYRRLSAQMSAPLNCLWGRENRTVGLRVPDSGPSGRRVENRIPGSDANPYLALAASLACGYLGMMKGLEPSEPFQGSAYDTDLELLPQHILEALSNLKANEDLWELFGSDMMDVFVAIKEAEYEDFSNHLSPWETRFLMLNV